MGNKQPNPTRVEVKKTVQPVQQTVQQPVEEPIKKVYTKSQLEDIRNQADQALEQQESLTKHQEELNQQAEKINREKAELNLSQQRISDLSKYYRDTDIIGDTVGLLEDMNKIITHLLENYDMNEDLQESYQELRENNEMIAYWMNGNEIDQDIYVNIYNLFFVTPEILDIDKSEEENISILYAKLGFLLKGVIENMIIILNEHVDHSDVDENIYYQSVMHFCDNY